MLGQEMKDRPEETISNKKLLDLSASKMNKERAIPLRNYLTGEIYYDTLYREAERVRSSKSLGSFY